MGWGQITCFKDFAGSWGGGGLGVYMHHWESKGANEIQSVKETLTSNYYFSQNILNDAPMNYLPE